MATLTYVYLEQTAVLGPLATLAEPHTYDLCAEHAQRLTAPRGWEVLRLTADFDAADPFPDDLLAMVNALGPRRSPGGSRAPAASGAGAPAPRGQATSAGAAAPAGPARRGHLRVLPDS